MAMTQHERRVVERYEIDTLGAPFKVTLLDCVTLSVDVKTGEEKIHIPDVGGLIGAVVRVRASHSRKLNGKEIRFIRNALGLKASQLSKFLGMSPEHFSRCEAGTKVMATMSEKMFRLFAYLATYFADPQDTLAKILDGRFNLEKPDLENKAKRPDAMAKQFVEQFLMIKIQSAFDPEQELNFEFRRGKSTEPDNIDKVPSEDNGEWENEPMPVAAYG